MAKYLDNNSGFQEFSAARDAAKKPSMTLSVVLWILMAAATFFLVRSCTETQPAAIKPEPAVTAENIANVPVAAISGDAINARVQGIRISKIELKNYQNDARDANIVLLNGDAEFAEIGYTAAGTTAPTAATIWRSARMAGDNKMMWRNADGIDFTRDITVDANYVIIVSDNIRNNSARDVSLSPYARIVRENNIKSQAAAAAGGIAFANDEIERESWGRLTGDKIYSFESRAGFVGFEDQYWQIIASQNTDGQTLRMRQRADGLFQADAGAVSAISVPAGGATTVVSKIYAGPKTPADLKSAAAFITGVDRTIDYGWFWFLAQPFLWAMHALYDLVGNYGIAIILLTIVIRGLMWPLTRKSYAGMAAMQKMQPEMQRIQKLCKDDKVRLQMEMMNLYKTHKTSPMGGCLPMLLQIPIFFALYKALLISVPMRQAGFLWIHDLAAFDPYFILPILMGLAMWWQQKIQTPATAATDPNNPLAATQKFMKWMPVIFTAMFAMMPAGLVLYWTVSNLVGIGQMLVMRKK